LIGIKPRIGRRGHSDSICNGIERSASRPVINPPTSRFAVGSFDTWSGVNGTLQDLGAAGFKPNDLNCLGLHRVLAQGGGLMAAVPSLGLRELPFQRNPELIGCTLGPIADRLAWRLALGAPTLQSALGHWLIPRHAAHLQKAVADGRIVLWLQLLDNDDERRAYQALLARSSNSVGVHDLIAGEAPPPTLTRKV
jgi:hypothetical protein